MNLNEIKKGSKVRIVIEDNHNFFRLGTVISVFHERVPERVFIKITLENGDILRGFQPEHVIAVWQKNRVR